MAITDPVYCGTQAVYEVVVCDRGGTPLVGIFDGSEPLRTLIWWVSGAPPVLMPITTWTDAANALAQITISSADSLTVPPGIYRLIVELQQDDSEWVVAAGETTIEFRDLALTT